MSTPIEFEKKFTLGNIITLVGMILTVGSVYGIQTMINTQIRKDVDSSGEEVARHREQITALRESQIVQGYDIKSVKETVGEIREEQKTLARDAREALKSLQPK